MLEEFKPVSINFMRDSVDRKQKMFNLTWHPQQRGVIILRAVLWAIVGIVIVSAGLNLLQ